MASRWSGRSRSRNLAAARSLRAAVFESGIASVGHAVAWPVLAGRGAWLQLVHCELQSLRHGEPCRGIAGLGAFRRRGVWPGIGLAWRVKLWFVEGRLGTWSRVGESPAAIFCSVQDRLVMFRRPGAWSRLARRGLSCRGPPRYGSVRQGQAGPGLSWIGSSRLAVADCAAAWIGKHCRDLAGSVKVRDSLA